VQLQGLTAGETQGGAAQFVAQVQLGQQLPAGQLAAGHFGADHHAVRFSAVPRLARRRPLVAVVLLVAAVMLEQLVASLAETLAAVLQFLGDGAAQVVALLLERFHGTEFWFGHDLQGLLMASDGHAGMRTCSPRRG
jgi:hypothetical protein